MHRFGEPESLRAAWVRIPPPPPLPRCSSASARQCPSKRKRVNWWVGRVAKCAGLENPREQSLHRFESCTHRSFHSRWDTVFETRKKRVQCVRILYPPPRKNVFAKGELRSTWLGRLNLRCKFITSCSAMFYVYTLQSEKDGSEQ